MARIFARTLLPVLEPGGGTRAHAKLSNRCGSLSVLRGVVPNCVCAYIAPKFPRSSFTVIISLTSSISTFTRRVHAVPFSSRSSRLISSVYHHSMASSTSPQGLQARSPVLSEPRDRTLQSAGLKRKRSSETKFYAVKAGYQPGVYFKWDDCLAQITGYKNAVCMLLSTIVRFFQPFLFRPPFFLMYYTYIVLTIRFY